MSTQYKFAFYRQRIHAALMAIIHSPSEAADIFSLTKDQIYYWQKKILTPGWKDGTQGGARNFALSKEERKVVHLIIFAVIKKQPQINFNEIIRVVFRYGFDINKPYISRLLKRWHWSVKKPKEDQIQKYTKKNIKYYARYLLTVHDIPWFKLKFLDESHFRSSELFRPTVIGPVGVRITSTHTPALDLGYSLTIMTSISPNNPVLTDLRYKSNTQFDFVRFVLHAIKKKFLIAGDVLIVDNARIHWADETLDLMNKVAKVAKIRILHLPTYSCELNPCELVFNFVKGNIRTNRVESRPLWLEIYMALADVNHLMMYTWYENCLSLLDEIK